MGSEMCIRDSPTGLPGPIVEAGIPPLSPEVGPRCVIAPGVIDRHDHLANHRLQVGHGFICGVVINLVNNNLIAQIELVGRSESRFGWSPPASLSSWKAAVQPLPQPHSVRHYTPAGRVEEQSIGGLQGKAQAGLLENQVFSRAKVNRGEDILPGLGSMT